MTEDSWASSPDAEEELAALTLLPTLPLELQEQIFKWCDLSSLAVLCQLNKEFRERITPLLWRDIDFVQDFSVGDNNQVECSRKFFALCDTLMAEQPDRWAILAAYVRKLDLGRLHGVTIVHKNWNCDDYVFLDPVEDGKRNVFDVIAQFTNLDTLAVYIKNWWGSSLAASGIALGEGITNLKSLKIGGQVSEDILLGLLAKPENIEDLCLMNLIICPSQTSGPEGVVFLPDTHPGFMNLKILHLCKLADLDGRISDAEGNGGDEDDEEPTYVSGMRWRFPRESEVAVLQEWATILRSCSSTLKELTLENRYLCCHNYYDWLERKNINPGVTHPPEYGAFSIRESQKALFPVLAAAWPRLEKLTLIGMGETEDVAQAVRHLESRVQIEQRLASLVGMEGDVTPEQVSTPDEFYRDDTTDWDSAH